MRALIQYVFSVHLFGFCSICFATSPPPKKKIRVLFPTFYFTQLKTSCLRFIFSLNSNLQAGFSLPNEHQSLMNHDLILFWEESLSSLGVFGPSRAHLKGTQMNQNGMSSCNQKQFFFQP